MTKPMTDARLNGIKGWLSVWVPDRRVTTVKEDVIIELVAEVERLRDLLAALLAEKGSKG